jgi:hypothetical protein
MFFRRRHEDPSPSIVELVRGIVSDAIRLVRENVDLVKARFSRTLKRAGIGAGVAAGGATMVFLGLVGLLVAAGLGLALVVDPWLAALIVSGALLAVGAAVALLGVKEVRTAIDERTQGPVDMETALQETRYRLEAELDALTAKLDPRHSSHELKQAASTNGSAQTMPMPRTPK